MAFFEEKEYVIITKHYIIAIIWIIKLIFFICIVAFLTFFCYNYKHLIWDYIVMYFMLPIILFILNYSFFKLILWFIFYYNNFILFLKNKIIILKSSLFMIDNLEIINIAKVTKIDVKMHGILKAILKYWDIIIEQQRDEVRILRFMPNPYKALKILSETSSYIDSSWKENSFLKFKK
jgi:hypothetical protein